MTDDRIIRVPRQSLGNLIEVWTEYQLEEVVPMLGDSPRILDVGAHVGFFSIVAHHYWPQCKIQAFEPHPELFEFLLNNTKGIQIACRNQAVIGKRQTKGVHGPVVFEPTVRIRLYEGKSTRLACSTYDLGDQDMTRAVTVETIRAMDLPPCDLLKIDTEGCELEILHEYKHMDGVKVLMLEFHRNEDMIPVAEFAIEAGFHSLKPPQVGKLVRLGK